jgi:predicted transcriptional regulator
MVRSTMDGRGRINDSRKKEQAPKKRKFDQLLKEVDDLIVRCKEKIEELDAFIGPLY